MIITIGREFGAGGRTVAKKLSEILDIPWYNKDFTKITAEDSGYSVEEIEDEGETISDFDRFLDNFLNNSAAYVSSRDAIFEAQRNTILKLAEKDCIIIGRCADYILKKAGIESFSVFLYADEAKKTQRAMELLECDEKKAAKYVEKIDHMRDNYYKRYTGNQLGNYHNYDLLIDTGRIGKANSADIILSAMKAAGIVK